MNLVPTYTALEIKSMAVRLNPESFRTMIPTIERDLELYSTEDLDILIQASMIMFTKSIFLNLTNGDRYPVSCAN